jgi:hypothetical protein
MIRTYLKNIHKFQLYAAVGFTLLIAFVAINNYRYLPALGFSRAIISVVLLGYSIAHLYILKNRGFYLHKAILFPIVFILFGLYFDYAWLGYTKSWAPATVSEANTETVKCLFIISGIFIVGVLSVLFKSKQSCA